LKGVLRVGLLIGFPKSESLPTNPLHPVQGSLSNVQGFRGVLRKGVFENRNALRDSTSRFAAPRATPKASREGVLIDGKA
jgi:hypothetical protein